MHLKPANDKIRALFKKLQALAERGVDGEKAAAQRKLTRLQTRYDFTGSNPSDAPDLFSGTFARASKAKPIYTFKNNELDIANAVKWAIESASKIHCAHRGAVLVAEATIDSARRLREISDHIAQSFRVLLDKFHGLSGVSAADRNAFLMGLYDGMMNESRAAGQRLPGGYSGPKKRKPKKTSANASPGMHVHPYSIAVGLGKQIRFSAPVEQITAELEAVASKYLAQERR